MIVEFESRVGRWEARQDADWFFADVPENFSDQIREMLPPAPRGFGAVRVRATVGSTTWRTSIFPGSSGTYSLPLKRAVRDAEDLVDGGPLTVRLEIVDL
jgi:hypothetical protein